MYRPKNDPGTIGTISQEEFDLSQEKVFELQHLSNLLHLFQTRNKNQHHHSIWYRHFDIFRRQLHKLLQDFSTLNTVPTTHAAKAKKKVSDPILMTRIRTRLSHWRDILVTKWQHAFSQLIADQRFSVLGLFLTATLAEVCQTVGITAELEEMGQEEVQRAIEAFGREEWGGEAQRDEDERIEDAGQVISREEDAELVAPVPKTEDGEANVSLPVKAVEKTRKRSFELTTEVKKKKRRKKVGGDAIDDIFG